MLSSELKTYRVQHATDKKKLYDVILRPMGWWIDAECSCPDWIRMRHRCKHIKLALRCYNYGF